MENATSDMPLSNLRIDNDQSVSAQLDEASGTGTTISARYEISNMNEMDGHQKESEDPESDSSDSFIDDSDNDEPSTSGNDRDLNFETPLTEGEIEELIGDLLEVESKAAEAQESLEEESLARVESEVRAELAQTFHGDDLEMAVSEEMKAFKEQWETALDDLETESSHLLEQLDGAGIELPCLYKLIESLAPDSCCTEAWRKRAHWVGSQISTELNESITGAESYLQTCHPVRRKHGKLLEEGASGFLGRKFAIEDNRGTLNENAEKDWNSFNELFQSHEESTSFGSKHWASVYLASTPQQAANMGLNLPGVDEVEEIDDIESGSKDPFYADAVANEKETGLTEEQKKNVRKVKEEDDANIMRKLQLHLKQRRRRSLKKQQRETGSNDGVLDGSINVGNNDISSPNMSEETEDLGASDELSQENTMPSDNPAVIDVPSSPMLIKQRGSKHLLDGEGYQGDTKRARTVIIDSDDEVGLGERKKSVSCDSNVAMLSTLQDKEAVDILDVRAQPNSNFNATEDSENFHCTACSEVLRASQVHRHPLLEVIICVICKHEIEETKLLKDPDCSECHCGWCGRSNDLITCSSCKMLFCTFCIKRNFGEERLSEIQASGWDCCCCSRNLLDHFILECNRALRVGGLVVSSSDAETDLSDSDIDVPISNKRRRKRRIRRILDDAELGEETKRKIAIEKERQEHLKSLQEQFAGKSSGNNIGNGKAVEGASVDVLGDATKGYIVNVVREENEEPVRIPPSISSLLKPHQIAGIRFMWENCIQSVRKVKSGDKGLGCILAHTMGLGKTFQVIAFLYTALRSVDLGLKTALIVTPVNVLHNWRQEFIKWRPQELKSLRVFMLEDVSRDNWSRAKLLAKWRGKGGILLIGYAAFRNLSLGRHVKDKIIAGEICDALQNGPDVLVCDEAHMIKNTRADITQALKQVKSQRRIALTGSPLQNNLMEYYCMVDFVREGFLGSSHEFRNRFQNPIENGQHTNSTSDDVKIMNQRSHILYEQLKGFVHRMDISVMKNELPPKTVFVIAVKLSPLQRKLYKSFLDVHGFTSSKVTGEKAIKRSCFFTGYQALARIWNHPGLLQMVKEHRENLRREDAVENFLVDDSSSDDNMERDIMNGEKPRGKIDYKRNDSGFFVEEIDWWVDLLHEKIYKEVDYSGKMVLLLELLSMSSEVGDKALVFSQSLPTLDLIELYFSKLPRKGRNGKFWKQGKDWYRLDGSTEGSERQRLVERFNDPMNDRVKCALISTRAGSLGINLHAANRVIVVDGSWNPTHDLQAIYRVWRYGQKKPVYAYRLMAHGTMEEKIYKRQVTKEGLAARVVDRQQIHRTMSKEEVLHLFDFGDDENVDAVPEHDKETLVSSNQEATGGVDPSKQKPLALTYSSSSSDQFMESLLSKHYPRWIANYHEHEMLLQENEAERLSKEEQDMAWEMFRRTFEWEEVQRVSVDGSERKACTALESMSHSQQQTKSGTRTRSTVRKCSNLAHLLTLRSRGIESGSSIVCGDCAYEISWENLHRDGKGR